ncbi:MAG: hypothetical protein ABSA21_12465 [Candidatus Limnocylindrales bacterium]
MTTPQTSLDTGVTDAPVWEPTLEPDPADSPAEAEIQVVPVSRVPARPRPRRGNSVSVLLAISALIAMGGISFAAGRATTSGTGTSVNGNANGIPAEFADASGAPGGLRAGTGGAATLTGTVVSVASDSITLKLADGSTVTVGTGSSTTYHNQTAGSSTDLATGETVQVQTSGGSSATPNASASPGTGTTRTATDVTITGE